MSRDHPADKALDEVLDEIAAYQSPERFESAHTAACKMHDRWKQHGAGGKSIDEVYRDRNLLACALAEIVGHPMAGWTPVPDDRDDTEDWAIVWVVTPVGQVSWHVPRDMAERLVIRNDEYRYDGHDRTEKNDRLALWCKKGCWR